MQIDTAFVTSQRHTEYGKPCVAVCLAGFIASFEQTDTLIKNLERIEVRTDGGIKCLHLIEKTPNFITYFFLPEGVTNNEIGELKSILATAIQQAGLATHVEVTTSINHHIFH